MRYQVFQYALPAPPDLDDLNAFLSSNRIASVQHQIVQGPAGAQLVFVVQIQAASGGKSKKSEPAVDYRERLSPEAFKVYSRLRDERKRIAESEGVPVYAVFTNAQLAAMVENAVKTPQELEGIDGLGKQRVVRYGERILSVLGAGA